MIARSTAWTAIKVAAICAMLILAAAQSCSLLASDGEGYTGRYPWWRAALGSLVAVGALAVWLAFEASKKDSAFRVLDDRIEHPAWKRPIYFREIEAVIYETVGGPADVVGTVSLRLVGDAIQYLPFSLTGPDPEVFAADLRARIAKA